MRRITKLCSEQRGCSYCVDRIPPEIRGTYSTSSKCPHDVCPYHELDEVDSYGDYLDGISDVPVAELLNLTRKAGGMEL